MVIVSALAAGCSGGDILYTGPAVTPETLQVPNGEYATFAAQIHEGSRAPMEVSSMSAACKPDTVCSATVVEKRVQVFGKSAGTATLVVELTHPVTGRKDEREIAVTVGPPVPVTPIAVGSTIDPAVGTKVELEVEGQRYRCFVAGPPGPGSLGLSCVAPATHAGTSYLFGGNNQNGWLPETIRVCVEPDSGPITSISAYEPINQVQGGPGSACPKPAKR
jgi:hypothetical protein